MLAAQPAVRKLGPGEFFGRAHERLNFDVPPGLTDPNIIPPSGDQGTDRMLRIIAEEQPVRPAAVLIPVVERDQPTVLLTQRSPNLSSHAGQISFPGGKIDATDHSPLDAALREAEEEVGLDRKFVEPIGYLDLYATGLGFRILPTLARVKPGFDLSFQRYRQQIPHALAMWTITLCHSPLLPNMQPEDTTLAMIERITTAMADLDSLDSF